MHGARIPCLDSLASIMSASKLLGASVRVEGEGGYGGSRRVLVIVKSRSAPSIDEVPIIDALERAAARSGVIVEFKSYEEGGEGSREERLAGLVEEAYKAGMGAVIVIPQPLAVGLAGRVRGDVLEALESSPRAHVEVKFTNLLYLPHPEEAKGGIELVGKRNSRASYSRIRVLEEKAADLGIRVKGHVLLDSNPEIMRYVTSLGVQGLYVRVPVNRLALYVLAYAECLEGGMRVNRIRVEEASSHTVYFMGVPGGLMRQFEAEVARASRGHLGLTKAEKLARGHLESFSTFLSLLGAPVTG